MREFRNTEAGSADHRTMQRRLQYLDEQNRALVAIQDKLERLSDFRSAMILSHDIPQILQSSIAKFQELVKTEACSVFLVDENGFEFHHEITIPESVAELMKKEIEAQILSGTFGWVINSGTPACVPAEVIGRADHRRLSIMIAPLSGKERTLGAATIAFEQDEDFIRQQALKLLYILSNFFSLSLENAYLFEDLKKSYFDTIRAVANSVEARDAYTRGHSNRVAAISKVIASEMGWGRRDLEMIDWGGMLHDLGKVGISDTILNKPGKLTGEEFAAMTAHPSIGAQIIDGIAFLEPLIPYIAQHHERYDGLGYPAGLRGEEIAVQGRLLAVADTYDAMTSDRPYRKGLSARTAYEEICRCSGSQFDPSIVRAFEKAFKAGTIV